MTKNFYFDYLLALYVCSNSLYGQLASKSTQLLEMRLFLNAIYDNFAGETPADPPKRGQAPVPPAGYRRRSHGSPQEATQPNGEALCASFLAWFCP